MKERLVKLAEDTILSILVEAIRSKLLEEQIETLKKSKGPQVLKFYATEKKMGVPKSLQDDPQFLNIFCAGARAGAGEDIVNRCDPQSETQSETTYMYSNLIGRAYQQIQIDYTK